MDWVGLALLLAFLLGLLWSWWSDRLCESSPDSRLGADTSDFSIYLYSSKRGGRPRLDE